MKRIIWAVLHGFVLLWYSSLQGQENEKQGIEEFVREALNNNPEILALRKGVAAAHAKIPQSSTLPDPMVKLGVMNLPVNSFDFDQEPMTGKQVMLIQRFPFFGTLGLRAEISRQMASATEAELRAKENEIVRRVKEAVYNLGYFRKAIALTQKNHEILNQFAQVAMQKYEVGKGLQQDVLRAQVALSKMKEKIITLQQKVRSQEIMLNTILGRPVEDNIGNIPQAIPVAVSVAVDSLFTMSEKYSPMLAMKQARIAVESARRRLAGRSYFPHLDLSVAYTQREDIMGRTMHDFFSAQAGITLPLWFWRNQRNKTKEAGLRIEESRSEYENTRNKVHQTIADLIIILNEKSKRLSLYDKGILPLGRQSLEAALSAYSVNKVDFLALLDTQKRLFEDEMAYIRLASDHEIAKAKLEESVGKRIF